MHATARPNRGIRSLSLVVLLKVIAATAAAADGGPLAIALAHGSAPEQQTKAQLERLVAAHDVGKWTFTKSVVIDERSIPHSHPALTLHTRHLKDDELLLSTYLHEQLHWFVAGKGESAAAAKKELRALFPKIPVGYPEGSDDDAGNDTHLLVVYLEYRALRELLGELRARQVMEFWAHDHYTWIYRTVLDRAPEIGKIAFERALVP